MLILFHEGTMFKKHAKRMFLETFFEHAESTSSDFSSDAEYRLDAKYGRSASHLGLEPLMLPHSVQNAGVDVGERATWTTKKRETVNW